MGVFIDVPRDVCLQRGVKREEGYMRRDDPETYADIVLDGTKPLDAQVDLG